MNKVLLVGNVVAKPQIFFTATSKIKYARLTIAINQYYGENRQADFVPVIVWRNLANFVEKYLKKGMKISIEGKFTSSTYQNENSETITNYNVTASNIDLLESKAQWEMKNPIDTSKTKISQNTKLNENEDEADKKMSLENEQDKNIADTNDMPSKDLPWELDL